MKCPALANPNKELKSEGLPPIKIGTRINTGSVVVAIWVSTKDLTILAMQLI